MTVTKAERDVEQNADGRSPTESVSDGCASVYEEKGSHASRDRPLLVLPMRLKELSNGTSADFIRPALRSSAWLSLFYDLVFVAALTVFSVRAGRSPAPPETSAADDGGD
jgi:hypothetical protein